MTEPSAAPGLWVRSDALPLGGYGVAINVGDDRAWTLPPDRAIAYAATCVRRSTEADHDAAVMGFLTGRLGVADRDAAEVLARDLRPDRVTDHSATEPLEFYPGYGARTRKPFLTMRLDGAEVGQLSPSDLRDHAVGVLNVLAAADLDAALVRCLTGAIGTDENRARAMVSSLAEYWPTDDPPRREEVASSG